MQHMRAKIGVKERARIGRREHRSGDAQVSRQGDAIAPVTGRVAGLPSPMWPRPTLAVSA